MFYLPILAYLLTYCWFGDRKVIRPVKTNLLQLLPPTVLFKGIDLTWSHCGRLGRLNENAVYGYRTSGQVRRERRGEQDAGAVPPFVFEELLADVGRGGGGTRHRRHEVEVLSAQASLHRMQPERGVSGAAVARAIPRPMNSRQRPGRTDNVVVVTHRNTRNVGQCPT